MQVVQGSGWGWELPARGGGGYSCLWGGVGTMSLTPGPRVGVGGTEPGWSITQQEGFPFLLLLFCFFLPFPPPPPLLPSPILSLYFPASSKLSLWHQERFGVFTTLGAHEVGDPRISATPRGGGERGGWVGAPGFAGGGDVEGQRLQRGSVGSLPPSAARCRCGDAVMNSAPL